ncbi:MAG: FG-GAP repeat domain-containing protein, partial [Vicinamibacterales bacterium]
MRRLVALAALAAAALPANETLQAQSAGSPAVVFKDVTAASGVAFRHQSGAFGKKYLPETMGSGVVFLDFDGDGAQDLFFVNSTRWPGRPEKPGLPALYRNDGKGRFSDVTRAAGLAVELYGLGAAAADYDNDGKVDLYVTCLGPNRLFRNLGGGRFSDVTATAGVGDAGFGTSAMFFDYDKDGRLDLVVANYVAWSIEKDLFCTLDGKSKSYCTPESYRGQSLRLYRGTPSGVFEDATKKAGLEDARAKSLGIALIDFDSDAWPDLFVA